MRDSFVFYRSFYEAIEDLPDKELAECFRAIAEYALNDIEPETPGIAKTVFKMAKPQIDANTKRYQNGTKGGRPPKHSKPEIEEATEARNSWEYIKWRDQVYERDGYACVMCGSKDYIEVHHKKDFVEFPELRYELSNGITLCKQCHSKIHNSVNQKKPSDNQNKPNVVSSKPNVNVNDNENVNENENVNDKNNMPSGTSADRTPEYPYKAVIDYLNTKMGTDYKASSKDSQKHIRARFQEGYKLDDFYTVIDKKVREWKGTEWEKFLRPATLFGTKFESYLNQKGRMNSTQTGGNKFNNFQPRDYDYQDMEKSLLGVK